MTALHVVQVYMLIGALEGFRTLWRIRKVRVQSSGRDITYLTVGFNALFWPVNWTFQIALVLASRGHGLGWWGEWLTSRGIGFERRQEIDLSRCAFVPDEDCELPPNPNVPRLPPCANAASDPDFPSDSRCRMRSDRCLDSREWHYILSNMARDLPPDVLEEFLAKGRQGL